MVMSLLQVGMLARILKWKMTIARGFHYLFHDLLDLGWEYPFTSQPYGERISTLPLIGWLILLLTFYVYAKLIFWIIKSIVRIVSSLIRKRRAKKSTAFSDL